MQKPMINGVEVKVGQKWKGKSGVVFEITEIITGVWPIRSHSMSWTELGDFYSDTYSDYDLVELVQDVEQSKAKARVVEEEREGIFIYILEALQDNGDYAIIASSNHKDGLIKEAELYSTLKRKVIHEVF